MSRYVPEVLHTIGKPTRYLNNKIMTGEFVAVGRSEKARVMHPPPRLCSNACSTLQMSRQVYQTKPFLLSCRLEQKGKGHAPAPDAGRVDMKEVLHQLSPGEKGRHGGDEWWVWG